MGAGVSAAVPPPASPPWTGIPSAGAGGAGRCRYCRCTEDNPCRLPEGDRCCWWDRTRTLCTGPACLTAHYAARKRREAAEVRAQARAREKAGRKRTPGQVAALIAAEKQKSRQVANAKYRARMKLKKATPGEREEP